MSTFVVEIETGNAAMQAPGDIADAVRGIVDRMDDGYTHGHIFDDNGNTVGSYGFQNEG